MGEVLVLRENKGKNCLRRVEALKPQSEERTDVDAQIYFLSIVH